MAAENTNKESDLAALQHMAREFTEGFNSGDVERIMRFYGDIYVDANLQNPVQTREQRSEYYRHVMRRGIKVDVHPDEIRIEGDWAFVRGSIHVKPPGSTEATELRYLEILRKQPDGSWQAVWGMDGPVQAYDPSGSNGPSSGESA